MENEAEFDEIENVSKSQLKRDSHAIQELGKRLVALPAEHLARIPLDETVLDAIALAHGVFKTSAARSNVITSFSVNCCARATPRPFSPPSPKLTTRVSIRFKNITAPNAGAIVSSNRVMMRSKLWWLKSTHADRQKLRQLWRNHQHANRRQTRSARAPALQGNQTVPRFLIATVPPIRL